MNFLKSVLKSEKNGLHATPELTSESSHFRVFFSVIAILCNHMGTQQTGANYR